ncbi:hypothetical protein F4604DRAFT_182381 [Suillus subluteus]|nr:hypothetical protein F4604DRAFT_182381 [Suillus subluteus]
MPSMPLLLFIQCISTSWRRVNSLGVLGTLFPPLAVAARFGIGKDFWLNLLLTICEYISGHVHNFYIQNVRNNKNHRRTPKWIERYGLVDTSTIRRHEQRSQWAGRYNDRNPNSTLDDQPLEEGQVQRLPNRRNRRSGGTMCTPSYSSFLPGPNSGITFKTNIAVHSKPGGSYQLPLVSGLR